MESRPSSSSVAKSPVLFSTSASASFHSRLSASSSSSQRRLRALSRADSDDLPQHDRLKSPAVLHSLPSSPQTSSNLPLYNSEKAATPKSRSIVHWMLIVYCSLSVAFFTARFFGIPEFFYKQRPHRDIGSISPINDFSLSYRLSRLLQTEPRSVSFSPFVSNGPIFFRNTAVTACIWVELEDMQHLEPWSLTWEGPLSVVVVTGTAHHLAQKLMLVKEIEKLSTVKTKAHFHMVQRMPNETRAANSYLNLARLFAQTRFVVLFPAAPLSPIPDGLFRKVSTITASLNTSQLASPLVLSPAKFRPNSPIPFALLSPLLVEQTYPIWCSERFFTAPSREDDWEECLWQFWLNSYGSLSTFAEPRWKFPSNRSDNRVGAPLSSEEIIHRRLSNRYRHESCVLAAKRLKDRSAVPGKVDPRKAQWLRKTCRQVMSTWGKELL